MWVDTHTHLYLEQFGDDREEVVDRALAAGVGAMYLPNVDSRTIGGMLDLEGQFPGSVFAMMGLHPCSVKEDFRDELKTVESWLSRRDFCAIGEIGIDLYWDKTHIEEQKEAFLTQVSWAKDLGKPVVIHCRESMDLVIELLRPLKDGRLRGIFHCFTGTMEQARAVIDLGFMLGIGGVLTFKNSGLDKVAGSVPLEYLVLETDSPYLAPVPYRGKRNESAYIPLIGAMLSDVAGAPIGEVEKITSDNAKTVFGHPTN